MAGACRSVSNADSTAGSRRKLVDVDVGVGVGGRFSDVAADRSAGPERMQMAGRRVGEELRRLAARGGVHLLLARGEQIERDAGQRGVGQRRVHHDRRQPGGRQRLLDPVGRQRIDERRRVADQQHARPATGLRVIEGGVAAPRRRVPCRAVEQPAQRRGLAHLALVAGAEGARRAGIGDPRVDHHGDIASRRRDRDRPGPPVAVGLDQGMAGVVHIPAVRLRPDGRQRQRGLAGIGNPKAAAGHDPGPARAVEHEGRFDDDRLPALPLGDVLDRRAGRSRPAAVRRELHGAHQGAVQHVGPGIGGEPQQQRVEVMAHHLPPGRSVGERGGPHFAFRPPDRVAGAGQETGAVDRRRHTQQVAQLPATGRQRLAERMRSVGGPGQQADRVPPRGQQPRRGGPGRSAPDDDRVDGCSCHRVIVPRAAPAGPTGGTWVSRSAPVPLQSRCVVAIRKIAHFAASGHACHQ